MIWTEVSQTIIPINGRQVIFSLARDVGERVKAERRLRESEERYRVAIEHSNDGVAIVSDSKHLYVNQRFLEIFGFAGPEDILGKGHDILVHPDDLEMVLMYGRRRQAGQDAPASYEFRGVHRDGAIIYCEASVARITYLGRPAILSYFRDITRRKLAQKTIQESEERYRSVVDLSPAGILICVDGKIEFANPALTRMLGAKESEELCGKEVLQFVDHDFHDIVRDKVRTIEVERRQTPFMDQRWVRLDGSGIDLVGTGFPFRYSGKEAIMLAMEDVSQRKHAEESLKRREEELEAKSLNLEEANTALKVLLKHRDDDKKTLENAIFANVRELVFPYIDKLKASHLNGSQTAYLSIIESGLNEIISPFLQKMSNVHSRFTPIEVRVMNLIKGGRTTKEIAELLHVSKSIIDSHRNNVRKKLGLTKEKVNLQTYLLSL